MSGKADNCLMTRNYFYLFFALFAANARAESVYYLHELTRCEVRMVENKEFKVIDGNSFVKVVLEAKKLPKNPDYVVFKYNNQVFVTSESCVMSVDKNKINNDLRGNEFKKKPRELTQREKFNANKYFVEVDFGSTKLTDSSGVGDYNEIFPSTSTTNPTEWGKAEESDYSSGKLLSLGFGIRSNQNRFLALKLRMLSGKKSDAVDLIDINTSISERGTWTYEDSFNNLYLGYKFIFLDYSAWKPVIGTYVGVSQMTSTLSDGEASYELSSLGIAALVEAGIEYHLNYHWGFGAVLGYEYLGKRSMTFKDETVGTNFKTTMSYSNQYFTLGLKYYFR